MLDKLDWAHMLVQAQYEHKASGPVPVPWTAKNRDNLGQFINFPVLVARKLDEIGSDFTNFLHKQVKALMPLTD